MHTSIFFIHKEKKRHLNVYFMKVEKTVCQKTSQPEFFIYRVEITSTNNGTPTGVQLTSTSNSTCSYVRACSICDYCETMHNVLSLLLTA